jgi:hypothetical protein
MLIRILTSVGGYPVGSVLEHDDAEARAWMAAGHVEPVAPVETLSADDIETAVQGDVETAMKPKAKKR